MARRRRSDDDLSDLTRGGSARRLFPESSRSERIERRMTQNRRLIDALGGDDRPSRRRRPRPDSTRRRSGPVSPAPRRRASASAPTREEERRGLSIPSRGQQTEGRRPTPRPTAKERRAGMSLSRETVREGRKPALSEVILQMSGPGIDAQNIRRVVEGVLERGSKPSRRDEEAQMSLPRRRRRRRG